MSKKSLSERDICSKYISSPIKQARWDMQKQVRSGTGDKVETEQAVA